MKHTASILLCVLMLALSIPLSGCQEKPVPPSDTTYETTPVTPGETTPGASGETSELPQDVTYTLDLSQFPKTESTTVFVVMKRMTSDGRILARMGGESDQSLYGRWVLIRNDTEMTLKMDEYYIVSFKDVLPPDKEGQPLTLAAESIRLEAVEDKPVIYLYPTEPTECSLRIDLDGVLTCTYPAHGGDGWQNFTAAPDGTLIFPDGREYYCLYWEGLLREQSPITSGFCVKGEDTAAFLADALPKLGLTPREANEMIIYWLPRMQDNAYNVISFDTAAYENAARLDVTPAPDTVIRVFMSWYGSDVPVSLPAETLTAPAREGFVVVEWGGSEIR